MDSYFGAFEHNVSALQWPPEVWALLQQCKSQAFYKIKSGAIMFQILFFQLKVKKDLIMPRQGSAQVSKEI